MTYRETYFYLDGDYKHGRGWSGPEAAEAFHDEINRLFTEAGWEIRPGGSSGACDTAVKGKQELYLHPMMASGPVLPEEIPQIEQVLRGASTVRLRETRTFKEYQDMSDAEYRSYLESRKDDMTAAILDRFRTKRRNLYVTGAAADRIAAPFVIPRIDSRNRPIDAAEQYVGSLINELIEEGRLVTADTRHGLGIRTAVKSELAQMEGQQAMGGMGGIS